MFFFYKQIRKQIEKEFKKNLQHLIAFLAQMVERWPFKPMAVGSIPTEGVFFFFCNFYINFLLK